MWCFGLKLPGLGLGFYKKVSVAVSKFEPDLGLGGYGLDYIIDKTTELAHLHTVSDYVLHENCDVLSLKARIPSGR